MVDGIKALSTHKNGSAISANILKGLRIDYTASTNSALWCRDLTQEIWVKSSMSVSLNQIGADGKADAATLLIANATNATITQSITASATAGCFSVFIKRASGTGTISITRDGGTSWTDITSQINSSTFSVVAIENTTVLNPVVGIRISTLNDSIVVDFAQNELGSELTSPILTTTSSATRDA